MPDALNKQELQLIYNSAAKHYDLQHSFLTAGSDQRGRKLLVKKAVSAGAKVLDCGSGTGSTALLSAQKVGPAGKVTLFDLSEGMLDIAKKRAEKAGLADRMEFCSGDMVHLPFEDNSFDAVLSTYSLCPLYDPGQGAAELYRVAKFGGRIGIAHSTLPKNPFVKLLADRIEKIVWRLPMLSLGCRSVSVLPMLEKMGARIIFKKNIGIPLWPFLVIVLEKPEKE